MERGDFLKLEDGEYFWNCGEKFYILTKEKWSILRKTEYWTGYPTLSQLVDKDIEFVEKNNDFICAMTKYSMKKRDAWVPYLFYIMEGGSLQRIQLEMTECTNCSWRGTIANPTLPDLYIAIKDRFEIMRKCVQLKQATCPICNGKLKRDAIWTEKNK